MHARPLRATLAALALVCAGPLQASDIDLFVSNPASGSSSLPNVLFIVDNTANWSQSAGSTTKFASEVAALVSTFNNLAINADGSAKFNVGVMFSSETGSGNSGNDGGYVRAAVRAMSSATKAKYGTMIQTLDVGNDKGNGGKASLIMAEAYRYFSGGAPYAGTTKAKTDFTGNSSGGWSSSTSTAASRAAMQAIYNLTGNALTATNAATYTAPPNANTCTRNYIIYLSNGPSQDNNTVTSQATTLLSTAGGVTTQIALSPSGSQGNVSDEWARFMKRSGLGITTYTIDVIPGSTGQGPGWTALLKSMAGVSGGKYTAVTSITAAGTEVSIAINKALSEILAANSVFASVSLPVSVNTQGTYLNQVFIGMFRPDANAFPRWAGNLKQYKLSKVGTDLKLVDADENSAINSSTGFITECARSYWTPSTADSYWSFKPQGGCIPPANLASDVYLNSNYPDGNIVEKGAHGYKLRSVGSRAVKTCSPTFGSCTAMTDFNTSNAAITQALLSASTSTERDQLINWAMGTDVDDENINGNSTEMRPSIHGDIVHSRPVAINFGTDAAPKVVVFYGGNDGTFRAINGNRTASIGSITAGSEMWAFLPPEFYGTIKALRDNTSQISFPGVSGGIPKPYGIDGVISGFDTGTDKWIFASMRRGGRAIYAFKASMDAAGAMTVTLQWKRGCPNNFPTSGTVSDAECSTGFTGIGQTWSAPKIFNVTGYTGRLLIMGGGYDTCEDSDPHSCTAASKGNKIYILDADTGTLLNTLTTDRGVVADVAILNDSASGLAQYAYVADLGGNLYRISMSSGAPAGWSVTKIASLGCSTLATCAANRKFMYIPDILSQSGTNYLLLGSGDREKPLSTYTSAYGTTNYFFTLQDKPADATWLSSEIGNCGSSLLCMNSLLGVALGVNPNATALAAKKGWYLQLDAHEQVVTSSITIYGSAKFSTHKPYVPVVGACTTDLGTTQAYSIGYQGSGSTRTTLPAVGLPPSPVAGMVTLDNGSTVPFCIGCNNESPLQSTQPSLPPGTAGTQPKSRVYWYIHR